MPGDPSSASQDSQQPPSQRPSWAWLGIALAVSGLLFFACLVMFLLALL